MDLIRRHLPDLKVRVVNVVDLMKLQPTREHPHGLSDADFERWRARRTTRKGLPESLPTSVSKKAILCSAIRSAMYSIVRQIRFGSDGQRPSLFAAHCRGSGL